GLSIPFETGVGDNGDPVHARVPCSGIFVTCIRFFEVEKPIYLGYNLWIVTIHRQHGFNFAILTDDHEPAYAHIYGDGEMKVNIVGPDGLPELVYAIGFKANDRRRAMDVVLEQQPLFLIKWTEIHAGR
ncbi:MAG: hypothetical protein RL367_200, partial [Pseudomonadota bacterium]